MNKEISIIEVVESHALELGKLDLSLKILKRRFRTLAHRVEYIDDDPSLAAIETMLINFILELEPESEKYPATIGSLDLIKAAKDERIESIKLLKEVMDEDKGIVEKLEIELNSVTEKLNSYYEKIGM
jgi:hypothetical protein